MDLLERSGFQDPGAVDALAERLLRLMRDTFNRTDLSYTEPLRYMDAGAEAAIYSFQLSDVEGELAGPKVLRLLRASADPQQVRLESAVHGAVAQLGFPVPRFLLAVVDPAPLGGAFAVMERMRGRMLLEEVRRPAELLSRPLRFPVLVHEALARVPDLLAGLQVQLHALDPEPLLEAVRKAGIECAGLTMEDRLVELEERTDRLQLPGLESGFRWLRTHSPPSGKPVICHGDFVFTNVCVERGQATGVLDWSGVRVADASYDVAGTMGRLASPIIGVPAPLRRPFEATQRRMVRRYLRAYRRLRHLDDEALHYHEAFFLLAELVWSGGRLAEGGRHEGAIEDRWLHPEAIAQGVEQFRVATGVSLHPAVPDDETGGLLEFARNTT
ncbi:MAG: phosphotransferase [bacterium]|nr:phosphotransferase [bacterium]